MSVTSFKIFLLAIGLSSFSLLAVEGKVKSSFFMEEELRKSFFMLKGFSEDFYRNWLAPIHFHLKWQVGWHQPFYYSQWENKCQAFKQGNDVRHLNFEIDLLGVYISFTEKKHLWGLVLGVVSDHMRYQSNDFQADQYSFRLSYLYFARRFMEGRYYRLDAGPSWNSIGTNRVDIEKENRQWGIMGKGAIGYAFPVDHAAFTLEGSYIVNFLRQKRENHGVVFSVGFLL